MTVPKQRPKEPSTLPAGQTMYTLQFNFIYLDPKGIFVIVDGVTLNTTQYSVYKQEINFNPPLVGATGGSKIVVYLDPNIERLDDILQNSDFLSSEINYQQDSIILMLQALMSKLTDQINKKSVYFDEADPIANTKLPDVATRAGMFLGFDNNGNLFLGTPLAPSSGLTNEDFKANIFKAGVRGEASNRPTMVFNDSDTFTVADLVKVFSNYSLALNTRPKLANTTSTGADDEVATLKDIKAIPAPQVTQLNPGKTLYLYTNSINYTFTKYNNFTGGAEGGDVDGTSSDGHYAYIKLNMPTGENMYIESVSAVSDAVIVYLDSDGESNNAIYDTDSSMQVTSIRIPDGSTYIIYFYSPLGKFRSTDQSGHPLVQIYFTVTMYCQYFGFKLEGKTQNKRI